MNRISLFLILTALIAIFSTGCTSCSRHHKHHVYSEIYKDEQTKHYYTRVYNPTSNDFWFYMYILNSGSSTNPYYTSNYPTSPRDISTSIQMGTGNWAKVEPKEVPGDLVKTEEVVQEGPNGEPTAIITDETPAIEQDVITEDTTQSQIEAMENEGGMIYDNTPATQEEIQENAPEPESHSFDPTENEPTTSEPSAPDSSSPSTDSGSSDSGGDDGGGGGDN
jgi:hypothetical protein